MKYFKTENSRMAKRYKITKQEFSKVTKRKYPFEQKKQSRGYFSIWNLSLLSKSNTAYWCYKRNKAKSLWEAHWKRYRRTSKIKYEYCLYAVKNDHKSPNNEERITEIDDNIVELYNLLKNQFITY